MAENRSQVAPNRDGSESKEGNLQGSKQITNINVGYCSKCLRVLDDIEDVVRDSENNLFCSSDCRSDFWREIRRHYEEISERY